jgi:hypothetical protein
MILMVVMMMMMRAYKNLYNGNKEDLAPFRKIVQETEPLPTKYFQEIRYFSGFLKVKHLRNVPESMILSKKDLDKQWDTLEDNEAWANL